MRRVAVMLALAAVLVVALTGTGGASSSYTVAAIFSNAAGLIPGQNVEIAGAVVGQVSSIGLTPDHRARVVMSVDTGFAPFRSNADCSIKPQSLIGEKFVECDPGSPDAPELAAHGGTPTVPLAHTHAPVDIDLVFSALRQPYVQRLSLIVNELGTGLAGRPADLQAAIKRAAPALQQFDRVLAIVDQDRTLLGRLIDRTDTVLAQVTPRDHDVTNFIDRAGRVGAEVAQRRDALGAALDRLPPLLAQLQPSAQSLAGVARDAQPVVHELRQATPSLRAVFAQLPPLTRAGRPALAALRSASDEGRRAVAVALPVARTLRSAVTLIPHDASVGAAVTDSLRNSGAVELINTFAWLGTASMARFDATSHIVPSYQVTGLCQQYATTPAAGCSAHWPGSAADKASAAGTQSRSRRAPRHHHRHHRRHGIGKQQSTPSAPAIPQLPQVPLPKLPQVPPLPQLPTVKQPTNQAPADKLLDFLMGK